MIDVDQITRNLEALNLHLMDGKPVTIVRDNINDTPVVRLYWNDVNLTDDEMSISGQEIERATQKLDIELYGSTLCSDRKFMQFIFQATAAA